MATQIQQKSTLNVVLGAMTFGEPDATYGQASVNDVNTVEAIIDAFLGHGHREIDTARFYGMGTSEKMLGKIDWKSKGVLMETKLYPHNVPGVIGMHTPEDLRKYLDISLEALKTTQLEAFYLHGPDRTTPYEVTLKAVDELFKEGKFKRFGISNYMSWEVAEIVGICERHGYIKPTIYQGLYNALNRNVEPELFPCLRKFGISFYEFNPLAGGFLTARYTTMEDAVEPNTRFDASAFQGRSYRERYWNEEHFKAIGIIRAAADKHQLTLAEVALRWVSHHSLMRREHGDSVLIGASSMRHIEQNLLDLEKGPLPEDVVAAVDDAWLAVKGVASKYFH